MSVAMNAAIKSMGTELDMMWWYDMVIWCDSVATAITEHP